MRLLGVRHQLSIDPLTEPSLVSLRTELPYLYRDPEAMPRTFWTPRARTVEGFEAALAATSSVQFNPHQEVILETQPPSNDGTAVPSGAASPRIVETKPERVKLEVDTSAPGWVVLMDTPYPGWRAWVDGKPAPLHVANAVGRAVRMEAGQRQIEMRFQPTTVRVGLFLSLLTTAGLFALTLTNLRRRTTKRVVRVA
jgi:uncharacterized membrane protein YfhO